jgi:hypothetical protein
LIVSDALPLPTEPKMKFESRDWMIAFVDGYTTRGASGPLTRGIGGSAGAVATPTGMGAVDGAGGVQALVTTAIATSECAATRVEMTFMRKS